MNLEEIERIVLSFEKKHKKFLENFIEWALLRNRLYMNLLKSLEDKPVGGHLKNKLNRHFFLNFLYGFKNWFKRYDILVFTNDQYRKLLDDKYFDRVVDAFISEREKEKTLFISLTGNRFHPIDKVYSKYVVSQAILDVLGYIFVKLTFFPLKRNSEINPLFFNSDFQFNVNKELKQYHGYYTLYRLFFKLYKPKKIYVATYYTATRNYMVKAARDLCIKVIECQHGYIGDAHPSYNCELELDRSYIPNELWVFSDFDKLMLKKTGVYPQAQIKVKGDYFLDRIKDRGLFKNPELSKHYQNYRFRVGISLQIPIEQEMLEFYINAAKMDSQILFVFFPRRWKADYESIPLPSNIFFVKEKSFYESVLWCTHHSTVFSTTAFEADYLGVKNILVDIQGLATKYFSNFVSKDSIVSTKADFIHMILK